MVHGPPPDGGASARRAVGRVAKRVVLGMNSWQTRVLSSKKEVPQSVLSSLFQPIAME